MANLSEIIARKNQNDEQWKAQKQAERENAAAMQDAGMEGISSNPDAYARYLEIQGDNPLYSAGNIALAMLQNPNITQFGTVERWRTLGRNVTESERRKGVQIFSRASFGKGYSLVAAYDISQTTGREIKKPELQDGSPAMESALSTLLNYSIVPVVVDTEMDVPRFLAGALLLYVCSIAFYYSTRQNRRPGEEHGSARWGSVKTLDHKYRDKDSSKNVILTQHLQMSLNGRKHMRNLLQIVTGGSGAGKTRYVVKPNMMQVNASYIVTDPKGDLARSTIPLLLKKGYTVRVFDLIDPAHSDFYNPFSYIRKDSDVFRLIDNFIKNTTPKNAQQNDPFWEKSEIALDAALMLYLLHEAPPEEQNMEMMLTMIEYGGAKENEDDYMSPLDLLFEALEEEQPKHIAVRQYKIFKQAAGKTAKSILVGAAVRLAAFTLPEIQNLTSCDTLELGKLGERKQAIFCVIPDSNDTSLNFLVGMLYTQAFQELYFQADKVHGGSLPVPVRLLFDEFANVALPDGYARLQATMRSRNIMATIILQNISQLKALFKDDWEGIIGNADAFIYLGGNEQSTHKYISELLGKETINVRTSSQSKGRSGSYSQNFQQTGRELMTPDEVRKLDNRYAIVFLRGEAPVIDEKYDLMKHSNIHLTQDGGAFPYVHSPVCLYRAEDLDFTFTSLDEIEIIETEESD